MAFKQDKLSEADVAYLKEHGGKVVSSASGGVKELPDVLPDPNGKEADMNKPVQVYILMGQSNMLGAGKPEILQGIAAEKYPYLVEDDGKWTVRKDVRNVRVMCSGNSPAKDYINDWMTIQGNIGPEIGIGHYLGHVTDAPVLILKSCIGNRSLGWDLLPPGSKPYEHGGKMQPGYRGTPDDPGCAIFHKGRYHLHYIYSSKGPSFAHVSSTDMVHWQWHPTVLTPPRTGHGMFSGTAFLTKEGRPAIIYHGQGSGRNQVALALDDQLNDWSKPVPVEPRTADGKPADMRHWDPDCWLMDGTYHALGGGQNPTLAKSDDLRNWEFLGDFLHPDFPADLGVAKDEDISCANLFRLGDKWMLLCISHGLGARYYLGDFKDGKFLPTHHALMNWARWDCFAPESLLTPDGRRVMWAWCTPWINGMQKVGRPNDFKGLMDQRKFPPGIQSLPRELSLPEDGVLRIKPLRELEKLRMEPKTMREITVKSDSEYPLKKIAGDTMELELVLEAPAAREFGIRVLCGDDGGNGFTISSGKGSETLRVGNVYPPFALNEGEDLTLRVFIDKSMIEVCANDRQAAVAWHEYDPEDLHVRLFSKDGELKVKEVSSWRMKSIHAGPTRQQTE